MMLLTLILLILVIVILISLNDSYHIKPSNSYIQYRNDAISITSKILLLQNLLLLHGVSVSASSLNNDIVVIGSNGKTGKSIVKMLRDKSIPVRAASRKLDESSGSIGSGSSSTYIDVTKIETIENAIKDSNAVIYTASASSNGGNAENVDYLGLKNVANECIRLKINRLVVISVAGSTRPNSTVFAMTDYIGNIRPWKKNIMEFKSMGEKAVMKLYEQADKSLSYTIIRPGVLFDGKGVGPIGLEINQGDTISGEINREDVAACAVAAATSKTIPKNVIFEVYQTEGTRGTLEDKFPSQSGYERRGEDYEIMFQGLKSNIFML